MGKRVKDAKYAVDKITIVRKGIVQGKICENHQTVQALGLKSGSSIWVPRQSTDEEKHEHNMNLQMNIAVSFLTLGPPSVSLTKDHLETKLSETIGDLKEKIRLMSDPQKFEIIKWSARLDDKTLKILEDDQQTVSAVFGAEGLTARSAIVVFRTHLNKQSM